MPHNSLRTHPWIGSKHALGDLNKLQILRIRVRSFIRLPGDHEWLGLVYLAQGRIQDAVVEIERERMAALRLQGQAVAYYALGRKKESDTALSELIAKYQTSAAFQIGRRLCFPKGARQSI